jgi:hypothetical protein
MPMDVEAKRTRERAEYRRLVEKEAREKTEKGFKNGLEALKAFADLFESEEEMDEFVGAVHEWRGRGRT